MSCRKIPSFPVLYGIICGGGNEKATDEEEIIQALKRAQAWEFVSRYEDGLDHWVEQGGSNFPVVRNNA